VPGITALRASIEGIKQRGGAELGDKTLLDSLSPAVDELERALPDGSVAAIGRAPKVARSSAEATNGMPLAPVWEGVSTTVLRSGYLVGPGNAVAGSHAFAAPVGTASVVARRASAALMAFAPCRCSPTVAPVPA
jgi:hypothetical protein